MFIGSADMAQIITQITDFTVKLFDGLADPVNTTDHWFKQEFWNGLLILNYFAYNVDYQFLEEYFADPNFTVNADWQILTHVYWIVRMERMIDTNWNTIVPRIWNQLNIS